jgi:uncharacterized 2Fe-2S/4Fe-4S cluster protein (DUF4445 family)
MSKTFEIDFEPMGKGVHVAAETNLLDAARQAGIGLRSVCGGAGTCGRCRVVIVSGKVSPPVQADRKFLSPREVASGKRLACRCLVRSDLKVQVPKGSLATGSRLQLGGKARRLQLHQTVRAYQAQVPAPTLHDPRADLERITDTLLSARRLHNVSAEPAVVQTLSPLARRIGWRLTVFVRKGVRGREIVGVTAPGGRPLGVAIDLGTTKIAGYLLDLETGEELAAAGILNPQISYGEDVVSRLVYAVRDQRSAGEIASAVREGLNQLTGTLADQTGVPRDQIVDACIVGNTAMIHLLVQLPVTQLALSPFVAAISSALDVRARDLGLDFAPGAYVHILPSIGGFVGADHVAMVMGSNLDRLSHVALGVDIGTNTEIALHRPGKKSVTSVSCASGPAFEGAHIRNGVRASPGAIEAVRLTKAGVEIKTIGGAPAVGLCGSGIVDAIAEMVRAQAIDRRGRLQANAPFVRKGQDGYEMLLVSRDSSGTGEDVVVTQRDVSEIQLAKSAIATGMEILIEATGTYLKEVREVVVAGAFGSYLDLGNAVSIGLLPDLAEAQYSQVGNAAGVGAKMALLSYKERARARRIALRSDYIELATYPGFRRRFVLSTLFPKNSDKPLLGHPYSHRGP